MIFTVIQVFYWLGSSQVLGIWHMSPITNYVLFVLMFLEWVLEAWVGLEQEQ